MNSVKKILLTSLVPALLCGGTYGAATGSYEANPLSLKASQAVVLFDEWDPPDKEMDYEGGYLGQGVCYYKVKLKRGMDYTVWITGGNAVDMSLDVYPREATDKEFDNEIYGCNAAFVVEEYKKGAIKAGFLYKEIWDMGDPDYDDPGDPTEWDYYVKIEGEIGAKTTLYFATGIQEFYAEGSEGNPAVLTFTTTPQSDSATLLESESSDFGEYYYMAYLEAGRKYRFRLDGATDDAPLFTDFSAGEMFVEKDPAITNKPNVEVLLLYPSESADYVFSISSTNRVSQNFKVTYYAFQERLPEDHPWVALTDSTGYYADIVPGREVADADKFYDKVIDETLCRIAVKKGERWVFQTSGANGSYEMRAYDATGKIQNVNTTMGNGTNDMRTVITAAYDGYYYVGVCNPILDVTNNPGSDTVGIFARNAEDFNAPGDHDEFDGTDDVQSGATLLTAYPGSASNTVVSVSAGHGPHVLSGGDWYDWYVLPGKKNVTYALRASFATEAISDVPLNATVYKVSGESRVRVETQGYLDPEEMSFGTVPLRFTADEDAMYYVCVYAGTGGQDYPPYMMHAMGYVSGVDMGLLTVETKGADASWRIGAGGFLYPNGASIIVPASKNLSVHFSDVAGFKTPEPINFTSSQYFSGEDGDLIVGVYTDTADPQDDVYTGYTSIAPVEKTSKLQRTLWSDDLADHYVFKAESGMYYNFMIIDKRVGDTAGDATFSISRATLDDIDKPFVTDATRVMKKYYEPGKYLLKVSHGSASGNEIDSAYVLAYNRVNVGTVQFASKSVSVSENDAYAEIVVTRSSSSGRIRLKYATEAYTAKPGSEYYPVDGVLEWADGDMEPKTIKVRLIPDLKEKWEEMRYFAVNIWPMPTDTWQDDEYGALIAGESKIAVKLIESTEKSAGAIVVKRAPSAIAGEPMAVTLSREGGADGDVGVVVATVNGSALRGEDFDFIQTNIVWAAGDDSDKTIYVKTHARGSLENKTMGIKLGALNVVFPAEYGAFETPQIPNASIPAVIGSELKKYSVEDLSSDARGNGAVITPLSGDWFVDSMGALRSSIIPAGGKVMFRIRVEGPGLFVMEPRLENADEGSSLLFQVSGGEILDCSKGERVVVAVPSGGRNVAFVARSPKGVAHVSFPALTENGFPFKWLPFSSVKAVSPVNKAIVDASLSSVSWTDIPGRTGEEVWYRVMASAKGEDPSTFTAILTNMTTDCSCAVPQGLLKAGRQFWWRVDYAYISDKDEPDEADWITGSTVWTFKTALAGTSATVPSDTARDVNGDFVGTLLEAGKPIELVQGARIDFNLADEVFESVTSAAIVDGALPAGVKLTSSGRLYGVPKVFGEAYALVQVNNGKTLALRFNIAPIGSAAGTFCGVLTPEGSDAFGAGAMAALSFQVNEAGALTSKTKLSGVTYSFKSSGYQEVFDRDDEAPGQTMRLATVMEEPVDLAGSIYTNRLEVQIGSGSITNVVALGQVSGTARLTVNVLDKNDDPTSVREVSYSCELFRRNSDSSVFVEKMRDFAGYYTVTLVPSGVAAASGLPAGNGPLALTVDEFGKITVSGVLPDRTSFSSSAFANLRGDFNSQNSVEMLLPLISAGDDYSFGGVLSVRPAAGEVAGEAVKASYVDSVRYPLYWSRTGIASSFDGTPFMIELTPVGGWYDTVYNLQRYYLSGEFAIEAEPVTGIPDGMLPKGYEYTVDTTPHGVGVALIGNSMSVVDRNLVKDEDGRVDFGKSVNAWDVKISFAHATGLVKGTAMVVSDGDKQLMLGNVNHYGILLMNRDNRAPLDEDIWTAGFYQFPSFNGWKFSLPFNIRSVTVDRDWSEAVVPEVE